MTHQKLPVLLIEDEEFVIPPFLEEEVGKASLTQ